MNYENKTKIFGIFIALIFFGSTFTSVAIKETLTHELDAYDEFINGPTLNKENVEVLCSTYGIGQHDTEQNVMMIQSDARLLLEKIQAYSLLIAQDPQSPESQKLQEEIITLAINYDLVPKDTLSNIRKIQLPQKKILPKYRPNPLSTADEWFCNYAAGGQGSSTPVIILPRLTPILLFPIPRLFYRWSCNIGFASCGGLRSGTGFMAEGQQTGRAIGFWGIGFSIFLPPVMAFGIIGYALYCSVEADHIEYWPPNYPPEINAVYPLDEAINIPITTSELSFHIDDYENELMSYIVTTHPDIGGDNANLKPDGTYTVPISGLEGTESYSWTVTVSDGSNTIEETYRFSTEPVAPIIENPTPTDGERYVPITLNQLRCHLRDLQGDTMDYTIETTPDIGSGSGTIQGSGFIDIPVSGLDNMTEYIWYVNVTDGSHWKHTRYSFQTEPTMVFNPFNKGWLYRKNLTIDHTKVAGNLENFPVLINTTDADLQAKAQNDGDDILFMDGTDVATRLYHEIEYYEKSTGELVAWVNTSELSSTMDTSFYLYYGNPLSSNQQCSEKVWNNNFQGVWHLSETGTGLRYDSSGNNRDATPYNYEGDESTTGFVDGADYLDGNDDHLRTFTTFDYEYRTVTFWLNTDIIPTSIYDTVLAQDDGTSLTYGSFSANIQPSGVLWIRAGGEDTGLGYQHPVIPHTWYQVHLVRNGPVAEYYINGVLMQTGNTGTHGSTSNPNPNFVIGARRLHDRTFTGLIDEIKITNTAFSPDWISTEYYNQKNPSSFYYIGSEELGP